MEEFHDSHLQKLLEMPQICKKAFFQDILKKLQDDLKLTKTQVLTMLSIYTADKCTMSDLADNLGMENSSMTTVIANLTERGYIKKHVDENDRRKTQLYLTEKGQKLSTHIYNEYFNSMSENVSILSPEEREAFFYHINGLCVLFKRILKQKE